MSLDNMLLIMRLDTSSSCLATESSKNDGLTQQAHTNDSTWRWINIESMLSQRCVPAG